ncbi:MAG: hypothetical protein ACUVR3_07560 [Candidatus Roseilinea sp.]|uniref:hypothetical protein n=1 Tax=Candidatus Roseilinea sp. TaxID=2838777 RepID=UPI00404A935D
MKANRGWSIITALLAGVVIGLCAGIYIYYAWVPPEQVLRDSSPYNLAVGTQYPQYREVYVARVANRFRALGGNEVAMQEAYDLLGVTTGDVSLENAYEMVRSANEVARIDLQRDPALQRFNEDDQLALTALEQALLTAIQTGQGPKDIQPGEPARARERVRLIGGALVLLVLLVAGGMVVLVDQVVGPVVKSSNGRQQAYADSNAGSSQAYMADVSSFDAGRPVEQPAPYAPPVAPFMPSPAAAPAATAINMPSSEAPFISFPPCTYAYGDDQFDEDFAINGSMGELIGECGASIADRLGLDTPARVSALAVWVFDKNDFQSTTKVLMSEYAYKDPTLRSKLAARGEPVLAQNNGVIEVLTSTLRVHVQVTGLQYNADGNPPNGYFERVTLNFTVYRRSTA